MKKILNKKVLSVLLAVMLLAALAAPAFATNTGTVTVVFSKDSIYSYGDGSSSADIYFDWLLYDDFSGDVVFPENTGGANILLPGLSVDLSTIDVTTKSYVPSGASDPLPGQVSVLDVILKAASINGYTVPVYWDGNPTEGTPGAEVVNVNNQTLDYYWGDNYDGTFWAMGQGFYIAVRDAYDSINEPTVLTSYSSNVAAVDGTIIYVDLGMFAYDAIPFPTN